MPNVAEDSAARQSGFIGSAVAGYERALRNVVSGARREAMSWLSGRITLDPDGSVSLTASNQQTLRSVGRRFQRALDQNGLSTATDAFTGQFEQQLPMFEETLQQLRASMKNPMPMPRWTAGDLSAFDAVKIGAGITLENVVEQAGNTAQQRALMNVGGLPYTDLVDVLVTEFERGISEAEGMAATAMSTYFRAIAATGYDDIEQQTGRAMKYGYYGPYDKLTRRFCTLLLETNETYTREEIMQMNNGSSLSNPWVSAGGWRCRHSWIPDVEAL